MPPPAVGLPSLHEGNSFMSKKNPRSSDDIVAIEGLMQDLETRLRRLNSKAKTEVSGVSEDISDFVTQALARIAQQVRDSAQTATHSIADEATEAGTHALKKIWDEMERRPLATLALAAGIGYLLGLIGRRD